jgi:hypothetical protein
VVKGRRIAAFREYAVGDGDVIVNVEVEAPPEALRKTDGATAGARDAVQSRLLALPVKDLAHKDAPDGRERPVVPGEKQRVLLVASAGDAGSEGHGAAMASGVPIGERLTDGGVTSIDAPGALFMNDPAVDRVTGDVYASDIFANAIFRFRDGTAEIFKQGPELESPNGLLVEGRSLLVASLGPDPDPVTFQTSAPGRLSRLDLDTRTLTPLTDRLGALDGLERYGKNLLVSDFFVGVYRVSPDGTATQIFDNATEGFASSADIGFDPVRRRLAIPDLFQSRVGLYDFEFDPSAVEVAAD